MKKKHVAAVLVGFTILGCALSCERVKDELKLALSDTPGALPPAPTRVNGKPVQEWPAAR